MAAREKVIKIINSDAELNSQFFLPVGQTGEDRSTRLIFDFDALFLSLLNKRIVFRTAGGVLMDPALINSEIVEGKTIWYTEIPADCFDAAGELKFSVWGTDADGRLFATAERPQTVREALSPLGGTAYATYVSIVDACINATEASIIQTGLCQTATRGATDVTAYAQNKLDTGAFNGAQGTSAYMQAVYGGFEGTAEEWLASLVGAAGPNSVSVSTATNITGLLAGNGTTVSAPTSAQVGALPIPDSEGYFVTNTIDGALQELGAAKDVKKYAYSETPFFNPVRSSGALLDSMTMLDFCHFLLLNNYGGRDFYLASPNTLVPVLLFTSTQTSPYWSCAKLFQLYGDYDAVLAWSRNANLIWRMTTNGASQISFPEQKWGWLGNQGIDWRPTDTGYLGTTTTPIIYAEYMVPEFGATAYNATTVLNVWRSVDGGMSWTSVFTKHSRNHATPEIYHFHAVRRDPFNPTHWYLSSGDLPEESFIWRSVDDGLTWTNITDPSITGETRKVNRTVNFYFTPDYIYWGSDDICSAGGIGAAWCRSPRNIGGALSVTILANLIHPVRNVIQSFMGVFVFTESSGTDAYVWCMQYSDSNKNLSLPVLVTKIKGQSFGSQLSDYAYGSKIFMPANLGSSSKLYPKTQIASQGSIVEISQMN